MDTMYFFAFVFFSRSFSFEKKKRAESLRINSNCLKLGFRNAGYAVGKKKVSRIGNFLYVGGFWCCFGGYIC